MIRLRALFLLLLATLSAGADTVVITILHTNDLHGALLPQIDVAADGKRNPERGGGARLATAIAAERASATKESRGLLLLDGGDMFHGTPEGNESKGAAMIAWMNFVKYDAVALGNHDWAYGDLNLFALRKAATFDFLSCTATRIDPKAPTAQIVEYASPWVVFERSGLKVAIVGFTTAGTPDMNFPEHVEGVDFLPYARQAGYYFKKAKEEGKADIVIALSHLGSFSDETMAQKAPGWDLIVGGHDHRHFNAGIEKHGTLIVQAGSDGAWLGRVDLTWDTEKRAVVNRVARLIVIDPSIRADPAAEKLIQPFVRAELDKPLGATAAKIGRSGPDCPLGALVADAIRSAAGADIALLNAGGIRNDLPGGPVTRRDLYMAAPFEDSLFAYDLTGTDLRALLDAAFRDGTLQYPVSGLKFTVDLKRPAGERIVDLLVLGKPVDPEKTYTLATTRFAANRLANDSKGRKILAPGGEPRPHRDIAGSLQTAFLKLFDGGHIVVPPTEVRVTLPKKK